MNKSCCCRNLKSLEGSIQNLLSVLYPPFEATAPTLLSQLFQIIDSRFQGDALRCLLDFLVPAKHILDTVQQAACAQYSDVLFLCEGWPLCLRDRVVVHLAPIDPLLLRPGDFYLQVAPFCDQSARIVVCSLLEEEELQAEVVEETPIPETSYPCIFSLDWLDEVNLGRRGTPLSRCLLAAEQGVVRLPWERVAVPDFVDVPQSSGSSMASAPSSFPPLLPLLPLPPPPLPDFTENSSSCKSFPLSSAKESAPKQQNSVLTSSSRPSAFSVETRICPAKHGIAVSLCLVDSSAAASSRPVKVKEPEADPKPIGWVSPNTWDSRFTGTKPNTASKTSTAADTGSPDKTIRKGGSKRDSKNLQDSSRRAAEGEYIDIQQAVKLFGQTPSLSEERPTSDAQMEAQRFPPRQRPAATPTHVQLPTQPQSPSRCGAAASSAGPPSSLHRSPPHQAYPDSLEPSECARSSEKPCTPCMKRRQGGKVSRAQELRCRYRDSYQAALQNPVSFGQDRVRGNMSALMEEDADRRGPETEDPWCNIQGMSSVSGDVCKESGEKNTFPYWKPGDANTAPCMDYRAVNALPFGGRPEEKTERTSVIFREPQEVRSSRCYGNVHNENGTNPAAEPGIITSKALTNGPEQSDVSSEHHRLAFSSREISGARATLMPHERPQNRTSSAATRADFSTSASPNRRERVSDRRCSSLSTAVVETSERCEVVIVEGLNVRRREKAESCVEVPQLHVVKCKNSTAFGLVSPKISRRKMVAADAAQPGGASITSRNGPLTENPSNTDPSPSAGPQKISQHASARPRPDHLPLGSPDPRAHPLYLGLAALTGSRDRTGRAIVELYGDHQGWRSAGTSQELFQMLLYFHSITRKEIREAGLTLIFDARKINPQPQLYKALMTLQERCPQAVNSLIVLVDKENNLRPEKCPGIQTDVMTSMKSLLRLVEGNQLSSRLDGSLSQSHCDWTELHQKLFPFVYDLHEASSLLLRAISKLKEPQRTDAVQTVQQCMMDQRTLMRDVLEDGRLVGLQRDGGSILARLRKESDLRYPHCEDLSDAVDSVTSLYNHVEEQAHVLVQKSNMCLEHLEFLLQLREMEAHFTQIQQWYNVEGERHLLEAESVEDSGDRMEQILNSFTGFLIEANDRRHHAMSLVSEAERLQQSGVSYPETEAFRALVCSFRSGLEDFLCRAEACGRELQIMVNVCDFCEQATALAGECIDYLDQTQSRIQTPPDESASQVNQNPDSSPNNAPSSDSSVLQAFQDRLLHFSPDRFQEVKSQAGALRGSRGCGSGTWPGCGVRKPGSSSRRGCRTWTRFSTCSRSPAAGVKVYVDVVSTNVQTPGGQSLVVQSTPGPRHPQWEGIVSGAVDLGKRRPILGSDGADPTSGACCNAKAEDLREAGASKSAPQSPHSRSSRRAEREARRRQTSRARTERDAAALSQSHTVGCQWFPWSRGLGSRSVSQDSCAASGSLTPPEQRVRPPSSCSHHGQPSCRILQEAQKFQISRHGSFCSEDSCLSERGAAGGNNGGLCLKHSSLPIGRYEGAFCPQESPSNALRLQRVMEELVFTEREYVRSLGYILTHYLPLMDRLDIPQDLRGKRGVIFGNLEKLHHFHSHYFLPELEACQREPAMVARCFLRHSESFGLYALYSKNKPQSDALILHRRHDIFKRKQQELGDMMDLSSYLLRPIQRISKYSLLLQDMLALAASFRPKDVIQDSLFSSSVCDPAVHVPHLTNGEREREKAEIQAAADLVRFQMRHGNDLLTMDAIQDCDVNLKEQGQLIRQDEFTVFFRKKKCIRRIFLFEDLILFSKTKRTDVGNDVYVYKQSFKTSDIGMTHNSGLGGLCFEIWFRRRKSEDTYTLKASSTELKKAWTTDLERMLWDQAAHSRELRMQERVFMGMGRKPFMDIQPSDAAICDRAVSCVLPGRIPVACCSHRGVELPVLPPSAPAAPPPPPSASRPPRPAAARCPLLVLLGTSRRESTPTRPSPRPRRRDRQRTQQPAPPSPPSSASPPSEL
ncbi:LOW QUALITY PROTEIN: uncharacterized protein si:dkey-65j6.2 [Acanthochromis polyacanthus]|uniref:LOW QUALITY PROTEIN: uncharacterized protein si:dkey-65j6.2 n=1 Tax=Acanthochromis polyacanthus TaxID=80966 RepID=UPI0022341882|nr:LOW QUALITY PROTEIN: uncharacterized protein si:dkey-65j6.2 [Acanthochromis polyacanthus]